MLKVRFVETIYFALLVILMAPAANAAVDLPPSTWKKGFGGVNARLQRFASDANYTSSRGEYERLPNDNSYEIYEITARARYHWSKRLSIYGGLGGARASSLDANFERTNTQVTDLVAGADWQVTRKFARIIAEIEAGWPFQKIDFATNEVLTSDGVGYLRGHVFAFKPLRLFNMNLNAYAHAGLKYRDEGLAALWLYGLGFEHPLFKKYALGAGIEGIESALQDEIEEADRQTVTDRVNGGSRYVYAFQPALLEARVWGGYSPKRGLQLRLGYGQTVNGVRAAAGQTIFLTFNFTFDARPRPDQIDYKTKELRKRQLRVKKAAEEFEVETEDVDSSLFRDDTTDEFEPDLEPSSD